MHGDGRIPDGSLKVTVGAKIKTYQDRLAK